MNLKITSCILILSALTTGCDSPRQTFGTVGGGALGAWAGSTIGKGRGRTVATAAGAILGALGGSTIGRQLDDADKRAASHATHQALEYTPVGQTSTWNNPDSGHSGHIKPIRTYEQNGQNCREFQQTVSIGGRAQQAYGTACRQADGSWKIIQ